MLARELYDDYYEYDDEYEDDSFDYDDDNLPENTGTEYEIFTHKLDNKVFEVEFNYNEETPLQYVIDEISIYIEDNKLDFARIISMHTEVDRDSGNLLIVAFSL